MANMIGEEKIPESKEVTSSIQPLACSLFSSCISTRCGHCFGELKGVPIRLGSYIRYCSSRCARKDIPIYCRSREHELLLLLRPSPERWPYEDPWVVRLAVRLILLLPPGYSSPDLNIPLPEGLISDVTLRSGAHLLSEATLSSKPGLDFYMHVLSLVLTNARHVTRIQDNSPVGAAVCDWGINSSGVDALDFDSVRIVASSTPQCLGVLDWGQPPARVSQLRGDEGDIISSDEECLDVDDKDDTKEEVWCIGGVPISLLLQDSELVE